MERVNWPRGRDILISVICVGIVAWAAISFLGIFVHAIVLLLLAMAVAYLITPAVNFLNRYIPRVPAALIVYICVLAALGGLGYALVFSLIQQVNYFSNNLPGYVQNLPTTYATFQEWLIKQGVPEPAINKAIATISDQANAFAVSVATNLVSIVLIVTDIIVNVLLVTVMSFYLTVDGKRIRDNLIGLAPKKTVPHVLLFEDTLNRVVGNYIRGQLTLAAMIGILAGFGSFFLGLSKFALIIGVLACLFETIPMLGPTLASIPAILISLLLPDPFPRSYVILVYFVIIQMIESNILGPRIVGHAVGLHPVASILALIIGAQLFGALGALLATPIVAAAWVVIVSLYNSLRGEPAETLLAKKRSPWIRPRFPIKDLKAGKEYSAGGGNERKEKARDIFPGEGSSSSKDGIPIQVKGIQAPGKIEHIDLLRPVQAQERRDDTPLGPSIEAKEENE